MIRHKVLTLDYGKVEIEKIWHAFSRAAVADLYPTKRGTLQVCARYDRGGAASFELTAKQVRILGQEFMEMADELEEV